MSQFIYLRGNPGVGKITVARLLEQDLGWRVFWFHDLKNAVVKIVNEHRIPRLMDEVTEPVLRHLLSSGEDIIFVRPSPDQTTISRVARTVADYPAYTFSSVRLTAERPTLVERIAKRDDPFRISNEADLDKYLRTRVVAELPGEHVIPTDSLSPRQVADEVIRRIGASNSVE